jgi:hypothetical protein
MLELLSGLFVGFSHTLGSFHFPNGEESMALSQAFGPTGLSPPHFSLEDPPKGKSSLCLKVFLLLTEVFYQYRNNLGVSQIYQREKSWGQDFSLSFENGIFVNG